MTRPSDWSALDRYEDPVAGSPSEVEDGAEDMLLVATTISEAAENLRAIASMEGQQSLAVEAFRERAQEVAAEIELVQERYAQTGEALNNYVEPFREAQRWSEDALEAAVAARQRIMTAENDVYTASFDVQYGDEETSDSAQTDLTNAHTRLSAAEGELSEARTLLNTAIEHRDGAAQTAMGLIDSALEVNGLDDSGWRQFLNKNADFLDGLAKVLGVLGAIVAVVALFIPGVNLLAVGLLIGLGAAGINFALAENGNKGWGDFAMDVVGLATLGAGKLATTAIRFGRAGNASRAAAGRAKAMRGARPKSPRKGGGRQNNEKQLRRQRRQQKEQDRGRWRAEGRRRQRAEYAEQTAVPNVTWRPSSIANGVRDNVQRNGFWNVVKAGGGDAYQMSYYNRIRHVGGGDAAAAVHRADSASGVVGLVDTGVAVGSPFVPDDRGFGQWAGDVVDAQVSDRPLQDDVTVSR